MNQPETESPNPAFDPLAEVLIIDNDQAHAVAPGAVPGTIRIPLHELRSRLAELPRDREIWVHCGVGQNSCYAVRLLQQHGFQVRNLSGGMTSCKMER
jgi:rhodanese-related sulfurtransferase